MNKKLFLLILPICLVFCLGLTTCEEEEVTDLWEKLRNTAWAKDAADGIHTIGFYGPKNGPTPSDWKDLPYAVIRLTSKSGRYYFGFIGDLVISRTGDKIIKDNYYFSEKLVLKLDRQSFNVSVSDDGQFLTIKNAPSAYWLSYDNWVSYDKKEWVHDSTVIDIMGKYSKISSDPNYNWDYPRGD